MSTQTEITRLQTARNKLRTKGVELGINTGTDKLDVIATAFDNIENHAAVNVDVKEGESYTIPKGYHNGGGKVSGVAGGGNYTLQSKTVTPTKSQKSVAPDQGYYGLASVVVNAIPDNFQDVTPVTAGAADVLANKVIVSATGETVAGTMPNNGKVTPDALAAGGSYTIPKGYHNGEGKVTAQNLASQTDGNAGAKDMRVGTTAWVDGQKVTGVVPFGTITYDGSDKTVSGIFWPAQTTKVPMFKQNAPTITVDENGLITAEVDFGNPFVGDTISPGGTESSTQQLSTQVAKTVIPTNEAQTAVAAGKYTTGAVTVAAIPAAYQDVTGVTAGAEDVLAGEVIVDAEGNEITGTMPNIGAQTASINAGGSVTISKGYHDGTGKITGNSLASQTPGDAAAANILTGKKAWVAGSQVTGTMPNNGAVAPSALAAGGSYTIPAGYHNGSGKVTAAALSGQTAGTATAAQILSGQTAWVGGAKLTGSMPNNGAKALTIDGLTTTSVAIPAGYHNGSGTVSLTSDIEEALAAI